MHMYDIETRKDLSFCIIKQGTHEFCVALIMDKIYLKQCFAPYLVHILNLENVTFS